MKHYKHYHFHWPGMIYAANVDAHNEREARAIVRSWYGFKRLPNQTAFWIKKEG